MTRKCRHNADVLTILWTEKGKRAYPCIYCGNPLIFGGVTVTQIENENKWREQKVDPSKGV